jgi:beta-lactamase regulating signal transducer with metallopeptidase domain
MTPAFNGMLFDASWICASCGAAAAAVIVPALGLLVARIVCGKPAPLRYGLLLAALVVLGIVPVVAAASRLGGWGAVRISNATVDRPLSPRPFLVTPAVPRPTPVADSSPREVAVRPERVAEPAVVPMRVPTFREVASCLLWVWLAGLVFCIGRVVRDLLRLRQLRHSLAPSPSPAAVDLLREAARSVGLTQPPRLFESAAVPVPVVIGPVRPVVVLPAGMATTLGREKLAAVLLHEAAHVAHGDLWVGLLQHAVAAVFWWCPPVHRLNRRLADVREEICDDYVVLAQGDGFQLAEVLVEMAAGLREKRQRLAIGTLGAIDEKPALEGRVERLVDLTRKAAPMTRMNRLAMAAASAFGAAALAIVVATTIHAADEVPAAQLESASADKGILAPETAATANGKGAVALLRFHKAASQTDADYQRSCQTHVVLVKDSEVLKSALQQSTIAELPCLKGEKDPIGWLTRNVDVLMQPGSEILSISVRGVGAADASAVVTAVAQAYLANVVDLEKRNVFKVRDALERRYKQSVDDVRATLDTYNQLAKSLGTADSEALDTQRGLLLDRLRSLGEQISRLENEKHAVDTDLGVAEKLREKPDPKLRARLDVLNEQIASIAKESDRVANEVKELGAARSDLIARKEDIERRMKYTDQLGVQLNAAEVDVVRPNQVELLGVRDVAP